MRVPLLDLKTQYQQFKAELWPVLEQVCDGQGFVLGPQVDALERAIAAYSGAAHGIGVSSGTDALLLALMGLSIGRGDAVITSPYTFFATGGTIARTGARPVFVDIEPTSFNLDPVKVEEFIAGRCERKGTQLRLRESGERVRALVPVHLYGQCADMPRLEAIARREQLPIIEDAAQAIGSECPGGRRAGSMGAIGCFSFFPTKNLGAFGDAGLCTAQDAELAETLRVLRVHGGKPKYYHAVIGGNFRLDELQAAVLNVKFRHLERWTAERQRNAAAYRQLCAAAGVDRAVTLPAEIAGYRHIYNQFVIRAPERDRLKQHLADAGVGTEIYYPVPLHLQKCFAYLGGTSGDFVESERAARETLALPIYPELQPAQLEYVVDSIRRFYARG